MNKDTQPDSGKAKVGQTGTFFKPGRSYELGEFINCLILEDRGEKLLVELEDGERGEIQKVGFTAMFLRRKQWEIK